MALTQSVDTVDENGRETLTYGTEDFPIAFFDDDLSRVDVVPHWHNEFEFIIITDGKMRMRIAGREFLLSAGEGYFVNSGILHTETLASCSGHQHAMVFNPKIISRGEDMVWKSCVAPVLGNPCIPFVKLESAISWQQEILTLVEEAWQSGAYEKSEYPIFVRYLLSRALSSIVNHLKTLENEVDSMSRYQREELRIKKALLFIERNYMDTIALDDISRSAGISASTCLRLFKTVLGTTPIQYLMEYRLQKAVKALAMQGNRTIAEIAYACGFSDASYFDRCFQKKYGVTPSKYYRFKESDPA
jgi:AraC-like DNA-binding protein